MNSKKILFRADAKPEIGIGDLMSLINLSMYFEDDGWTTYFMIRNYPAAIRLIEKYRIKNIRIIDSHISISKEVIQINNFLKKNNIDLIFFEITENKLSDYVGLLKEVYKACVSFDGNILPDMDLVVDWDVEAEKYFNTEKYPNTKLLTGPEYVILPHNFDNNLIKRRKYNAIPKKVLVCMGGADEYNFTCKILDLLIEQRNEMHVTVVVGSGYTNQKELKQRIKTANFNINIKENISNMFKEYMACDIAIGAGGLTSSELVATGTPSYLVAIYEHQEARCKYFDKMGWATYLGNRFNYKKDFFEIDCKVNMNPDRFFDTKVIVKACDGFLQ